MKIYTFHVFKVKIPMRFSFSHNLSNRFQSESIIVRISDEKGNIGFGEGAPRTYVTGEDLLSCESFLKNQINPWIIKKNWNCLIQNQKELLQFLKEFHTEFPNISSDKVIAWNAAKSATELALIDCLFHRIGASFHDFFSLHQKFLNYGTGIGAYPPIKSTIFALSMFAFGFKDYKVKLNRFQDFERLDMIRFALGQNIRIRLDANSAYDLKNKSDINSLNKFNKLNIISIEQPFIRGQHKEISYIKKEIGIPLMADESLITKQDALDIIETKSYDAFNLRISRLGGIYPFIKMVNLANENHIWFQIGCHVGELSILSKVGQLLASHFTETKYLEGGYGNLLLKSDIDFKSNSIGYAGKLEVQKSLSFGYTINEKILQKYSN